MSLYISFFQRFLQALSSRLAIGGLQITDLALQYVLIRDKTPIILSMRIPPGVVAEGRILDSQQFTAVLKAFYDQIIAQDHGSRTVPVVVCLPAAIVYTQMFRVPGVERKKMWEAADLNLQAISPIETSRAYMSSQLVEETPNYYELFGAFVEREPVNTFRSALESCGFYPIAFEFPSLALARLMQFSNYDTSKLTLVFYVSSDGIDIFILRNGFLVFDYFHSWRAIQGDGSQITGEAFEAAIVEHIRRVVNFSISHFQESVGQIFSVTPGIEAEVKRIIETNFQLPFFPLTIPSSSLASSWYAVLGSSVRGTWDRSRDTQITLGGESSTRAYYLEYFIAFMRLWRNVFVGTIGLLLIVFIVTSLFLQSHFRILQEQQSILRVGSENETITDLEDKATRFNSLISTFSSLRDPVQSPHLVLAFILSLASEYHITLDHFDIASDSPIILRAYAVDYAGVITFKNAISEHTAISRVDLPLSEINVTADGSVFFTMNFEVNREALFASSTALTNN